MNTRTKWVVAGATSVLGLGTVFGAVGAASALDLDRSDDVQPTTGIVVGGTSSIPGSAASPVETVTPAAPVAPSQGDRDSANSPASPVSPASPISAASPASPVSAISAVSADSDD